MGPEQGHRDGPAIVGRADHADALIAFLDVLDQPVDGVVGIGRVIGLGGVERTDGRTRHHVVALRAVFAADILVGEDIPVIDPFAVGRADRVAQVQFLVFGAAARIVRRAREQYRQPFCVLGNQDHGVQFDAVAHRYHHVAFDIVVADVGSVPFRGNVGAQLDRIAAAGRRRRRHGDGRSQIRGGCCNDGVFAHKTMAFHIVIKTSPW